MKLLKQFSLGLLLTVLAYSCQSSYQIRDNNHRHWEPNLKTSNAEKSPKKVLNKPVQQSLSIAENETINNQYISEIFPKESPENVKKSIPKIAIQNARKMASLEPKQLNQAKKFPKGFKKNVQEVKATFLDYEGPNTFITYGLYTLLAGLTLFLLGILLFFIFTNGTMTTTNAAIGFPLGLLMAAGVFLFVVGCLMWLLGWMAYGLGIY
jgi:hypothetical protein